MLEFAKVHCFINYSLSNEAANNVNVNIPLLASPKKNPDQLVYDSWITLIVKKKGNWKTCLLQVVPDSSNAFLYSAKLNFDYCPAYSL